MALMYGTDTLLQQAVLYKPYRLALVTNNAATTVDGTLSRVALIQQGFNIVKLFSPEHGLSAEGADGVFQKNNIDSITSLPAISLYGDRLYPADEDLHDIDIVLFDLPDVGCRFYTYQWTLSYIMESCHQFKKPLVVLDRPNPLSGNFSLAEGPMLDEACASFIGRWNIPLRHSCTIGELAFYWKTTKLPELDLTIIPVHGWERDQFISSMNVPFIPPSPGLPCIESILLYPALALLEGINVSEGRGTVFPFQCCGAPWINSKDLFDAFNTLKTTGVTVNHFSFVPVSGKYSGEKCFGIKFSVTDPLLFRSVTMGLLLVNLFFNLYPNNAEEHFYITNANPDGKKHLDKLTGINESISFLKKDVDSFRKALPEVASCNNWKTTIAPFLLY